MTTYNDMRRRDRMRHWWIRRRGTDEGFEEHYAAMQRSGLIPPDDISDVLRDIASTRIDELSGG